MSQPNFSMGGASAEEAAKAQGGKFARVNYFSLDEGKQTYVRFVTDSPEWIWIQQHPSVPTKNAPADYKGNWPAQMPAVCRHAPAFAAMYSDCYVCDTPVMNPRDTTKPLKPALRVWALAVEREPVVEGGVTKGYRTVMEEVDERDDNGKTTGKKIKQPKILVVNMGMKNFFSGLQGLYTAFGTVCAVDMMIRRTGSGLDTDYQIIPLPAVPGVEPGTPAFDKFLQAVKDQGIDLGALIASKADDEYYGRFFDPTKDGSRASDKDSGGTTSTAPQGASTPAQSTSPTVDPARLAAMRDRVRGTQTPEQPAEPPAGEPVVAAEGPIDYDAA